MNRIDTQSRITRNLATLRYQLGDLARTGLYQSLEAEELVKHTLNAATNQSVRNLNAVSNNFPGIDLLSADGTLGYQATRHVTKKKVDQSSLALVTEHGRTNSPINGLRDVYVVGLTCVNNAAIRRWEPIRAGHSVRIRAIELSAMLDLSSIGDDDLLEVDDVIQGFVHNWGRSLQSDATEIRVIVGWLDRPAVRDSRTLELSWDAMNTAMEDIRRLIARGVDDQGNPVTRPRTTFQAPYNQLLEAIYDASHQISRILTPSLQGHGTLRNDDVNRMDVLRHEIQRHTNDLCNAAGIASPEWDG